MERSTENSEDLGFPFIDLKAQQRLLYPELLARIERLLAPGQYILGPEGEEKQIFYLTMKG